MKRYYVIRKLEVTQDFYVWADTEDEARTTAGLASLGTGGCTITRMVVVDLVEVPPEAQQ